MIDATLQIRRLNDSFRRSLSGGGERLMTAGIAALPPEDQDAILAKVIAFDTFTDDNDPHGEHDFGVAPSSHFRHRDKLTGSDAGYSVRSAAEGFRASARRVGIF